MQQRSERRLPRWLAFLIAAVVAFGTAAAAGALPASARTTLCTSPNYGYDCVAFSGYSGQSTWGYPVDDRGHNCTNYAAYRLAGNGAGNPGNLGHAYAWDDSARSKGFVVDGNPVVGSIAQWDGGSGHVAYVETVTNDYVEVTDDNWNGTTTRARYYRGHSDWPEFIHIQPISTTPPPPPDSDGDGVQDSEDECPNVKGYAVNQGCPIRVISGAQDFNGNGRADILWYGPGSQHDALWYGHANRSAQFNKEHSITVAGGYTAVSGDFDGDGYGDIFWYGPGGANDAIWYGTGDGGQFDLVEIDVVGTYVPVTGDFDGDGRSDIFWYGSGSAHDAIWYGDADRATRFNATFEIGVAGAAYTPISGDFDGDGYGDILWYRPGSADDTLWYGTASRSQFIIVDTAIDGTYVPVVGDFNGNGRDDILLYGPGSNHDAIWYGHANRSAQFNKSLSIEVVGAYIPVPGDFDGDGYTDILWYRPGSASDTLWYGTSVGAVFTYIDSEVVGRYIPIAAG